MKTAVSGWILGVRVLTTKTNKELLESCKTHLEYGIDDIVTPIMDDFQELFTRFEKQIPKKIIKEEYMYGVTVKCINGHNIPTVCRDEEMPYCPFCGQRLKWRDEE